MADIPYDDSPNIIAYRVRQLAKTAADLITWQKDVDKTLDEHESNLINIGSAFKELKDEVKGMRTALLGLALSIAGSSVIFALTVLTAVGKLF